MSSVTNMFPEKSLSECYGEIKQTMSPINLAWSDIIIAVLLSLFSLITVKLLVSFSKAENLQQQIKTNI